VRIAGVPLRVSPGAAVFAAFAAWRAYDEVDGYVLAAGPSIDPDRMSAIQLSQALVSTYSQPSSFTTIASGWVIAAAIGAALVVLGSVLLHELGHLAALRLVGVEATGIHLNGFGGAVTFHDDDRLRAGSLALIAGAGPLATAALAAMAWAALGGTFDGPEVDTGAGVLAVELLRVCAFFNAVALVLNLLPLRGLDGRHLLTAARLRTARG
jgi:Zn-dependent protease